MPLEPHDIAIAGASLTGMTLALALKAASAGELRVAVFDRPPPAQPQSDLRAFALSAASVKLLTALDLWRALEADAQPVTRIDITGGRLESPARQQLLSYENITEDGLPASHIVPAARVREVLTEAFRASGILPYADGEAQTLTVEAGNAVIERGAATSIRARLAVAAEGRTSPLRGLAGLKTMGWTYPQTAIVTEVMHEEPHNGVATQHFLEAGPFAILPLTGGYRSSLVWTEATGRAEAIMRLDDSAFLQELEQRFGGILGGLTLSAGRMAQPLQLFLVRDFVADRVAVVGDAARMVHPLAGQGLNLGLRDVAALAECIIDTARLGLDIGAPAALARYQRWRRFDSTLSAAAMDGLNRLFSNDNPALRVLRETGLGLTDRLPGLKRFFVAEAAGLTGDTPKLLQGELP